MDHSSFGLAYCAYAELDFEIYARANGVFAVFSSLLGIFLLEML